MKLVWYSNYLKYANLFIDSEPVKEFTWSLTSEL